MWLKNTLEEVSTFISRGISPKYIEKGGIRVLNQKCIRNHVINYDLARRHNFELKKFSEDRFIKKGDVLINSTGQGTLGRVAQVREDPKELTTVDSHITIVRPKEELFYLEYFGYSAIAIEKIIKNYGQGASGQTELAKSKVQNELEISFPISLKKQKNIVAKLDATFAEIDRIKRINQIRIADSVLFNQKYLSSIEAKKKQIGDLADIKTGKLNANAMTDDGEYPFFTCSKEIFKINNYAFDCEAVLLAGNNASGDFNVKHYIGKFNAYQRTYVITVKEKVLLRSRYLYFQLINSLNNFKKMSVGTGTRFLKLGMIKEFAIPLPSLEEQDQILRHLEIINEETKHIKKIYNDIGTNLLSLNSAILSEELQKKSYE